MAYYTMSNTAVNFFLPPNESSHICIPYGSLDSTSDQAFMTTGYAILLILSLLGNVLVIAVSVYKRHDQLRTPVNYFIVNMAASDLLVALFVLPRAIKHIYLGWGTWLIGGVLGNILCRVVNLADEVSLTVSSQSMVFIAAERFLAVVFPTKLPLNSRRTTPRFFCFTWIFSVIFLFYYLFGNKLVYKEDRTPFCDNGLPQIFDTWQDLWRADRISLLAIYGAIPFILMTIFYTAIIVTLCRQQQIATHLSSEAQQRRTKKNQRITLMLVTVVAVFFISWRPYYMYVYFFMQYYSRDKNWSCNSIKWLYLSGRCMNYFYTAINPLIYYTFNAVYRQGFNKLLRCLWSCPCCCRQIRPLPVAVPRGNIVRQNEYQREEIELQVFSQNR